MALPVLTPAQRDEALRKAMDARRRRAELTAQIRSGALGLEAAVERARADEVLAKLRVETLLQALPGVGPARAGRAMTTIGIAPSRRVGGLGDRQRVALLAWFEGGTTFPEGPGPASGR